MLKVMVVEDEEQIRMILGKMIEKSEGCQVVSSCGNFAAAISDFIKYRPQVVFMDIDLGGESGLDCAKAITEVDPKVKIVFATAHSEYMANAFEIYAFDYLVKPFDLERITKTLARIKSMTELQEQESTSAKTDTSFEKLVIRGKEEINLIDTPDIIMVERTDGMCRIVTKEEIFITTSSLSAIQEKLDPEKFMRCHKSYIVRLDAIKKLEVYGRWTYTVTLKDTDETALMTADKYNEMKQNFAFWYHDAKLYYIVLTASEEAITERVRARGDVEMIDRALFLKKELEEMPENQDHIYDNSQKTLAEEISEISSNIESYLIK